MFHRYADQLDTDLEQTQWEPFLALIPPPAPAQQEQQQDLSALQQDAEPTTHAPYNTEVDAADATDATHTTDDDTTTATAMATETDEGSSDTTAATVPAATLCPAASSTIMSDRAVALETMINARKSMTMMDNSSGVYPDSTVRRPYIHNPNWGKIDPLYRPVEYTDARVADADADILHAPALMMFNEIDAYCNVDRRSYSGTYMVMNGIPRNPVERTGIVGRGSLPRWGPNHNSECVITRWQRDAATGEVVLRDDSRVLEVLVTLSPADYTKVVFPCIRSDTREALPQNLETIISLAMADQRRGGGAGGHRLDRNMTSSNNSNVSSVASATFEDDSVLQRSGRYSTAYDLAPIATAPSAGSDESAAAQKVVRSEVYTGYLRDDLNTDNAWKETSLINYHDNGDRFSTCFNLLSHNQYRWAVADENINLMLERHRESLMKVTERHGAFFADKMSPVFKLLLALIERKGLRQQGLYRLSGSAVNIKVLKAEAILGKTDMLPEADVHELTGLLKSILREMTPPLLTFTFYNECLEVGRTKSVESVRSLFLQLPIINMNLLLSIVRHLKRVEADSEFNKMTLENISLVFGPTLIRSPDGLAGDLRDHKVQCLAAKTIIGCTSEELDAIEKTRGDQNTFAKPAEKGAAKDIAPEGTSVVVRRRKSRDPDGDDNELGMRKRAASCAAPTSRRRHTSRRVFTLSEADVNHWEKTGATTKLSKLSSLRSSETAESVTESIDCEPVDTLQSMDSDLLAPSLHEEIQEAVGLSLHEEMQEAAGASAPLGALAKFELVGKIDEESETDGHGAGGASPEGFEDSDDESLVEQKEVGSRVLQLNLEDEDGLPCRYGEEIDDDTMLDEDGLPIAVFDPSLDGIMEEDDDGTLDGGSSIADCEITLRDKPHLKPISSHRISSADLCMIASPARKARKALKVSSLAASYDTRKAGYVQREVGSGMRKRYFELQGSILKIYKSQPKGKASGTLRRKPHKAEYLNMSADTTVRRRSKLELELHLPSHGFTQRLKLRNEDEASDWMRVLENSTRILNSTKM